MYYHCRPLKHVEYGKVFPPPIEKIRDHLEASYKWLGKYCGYFPQVWLSRSHLSITGYKNSGMLKQRQYVIQKRSEVKEANDSVLFGFDLIAGFPVSYRYWELMLMFMDDKMSFKEQNEHLIKEFTTITNECKAENDLADEEFKAWDSCNGDLDLFLNKYLFVEKDQVVVPSLNLKCAKKIICRNEKQKKKLRHMGFIEDRIEIKNLKPQKW